MIYFLKSHGTGLIKIGRTSYLRSRRAQLDHQYQEKLELLGVVSEDVFAERGLHKVFAKLRVVNEWFADSPSLRRFIAENATLDLPEADSPRNEVLVPIDRVIAAQAKKNAEDRGIPIHGYLNDLLRDAVDKDFKKNSGRKHAITNQDLVTAFDTPIVTDVPERTFGTLVGTKDRVFFDGFPLASIPSRLVSVIHRLSVIHSQHRGFFGQIPGLPFLASHMSFLFIRLRRFTKLSSLRDDMPSRTSSG